jgi:hypothetical protein
LTLTLAACGGNSRHELAPAQTVQLGWREVARSGPGAGLVFVVRDLTVTGHGWRVRASVRNRSAKTFLIGRPHHFGQTEFGLAVGEATVFETRASPPIPGRLLPGGQWTGTFAGPDRLGAGVDVRVVFGRFTTFSGTIWRRRWVTDHTAQLRGRQA